MSELLIKLLKYIGHPIPAWSHIEHKAVLGGKLPCAPPDGCVFFKNSHIVTRFSKERSTRKTGNTRTENCYFFTTH